MHVVIVGAGAVGTLYGGWLIAGGVDVSFVARGASLEALRHDGLTLTGDRGEFRSGPVAAEESIGALRPADVIVFAMKLYDLREAANAARAGLVEGGLAVGLQNGISAYATLREFFAHGQIAVGPVYSAARRNAPAAVEYSGARHLVVIGGPGREVHRSAPALVAGWRRAGIQSDLSDGIEGVLWTKFLGFATNAALTCLSRQAAGVVYHDADLLDLARASIREIMALAAAEGVELADDAEDSTIRLLQSFPPEMVASMRQDLDAGRRLELDDITGAIVRLGRKHGIATPTHDVAYACLKPFRDGVPIPVRSVSHDD